MQPTPQQIRDCILALLERRRPESTICPSEAARALAPGHWRGLMPEVRAVATTLALEGRLEIRQQGRRVPAGAPLHGPIRLGRPRGAASSDTPPADPATDSEDHRP